MQLRLVGLELLPGGPDGRVLVRWVLELDDAQGQAVHEQHHVGPAVVLVFGDRELIDGQQVVVGWSVEVDDLGLGTTNLPVVGPVLHRHAVDHHAVKGAVSGLERRPLGASQLSERIVERWVGELWIKQAQSVAQPALQHHLIVVLTLSTRRVRRDIRSMGRLPAEALEPFQRGLFDD